jgi:hypothetical protein
MRPVSRNSATFEVQSPSIVLRLPWATDLTQIDREPTMISQRMLAATWIAVVLIGALEFKLIRDTDIFWQVKLGQIMLEEGRIPRYDRFTYTHAGEPAPPIYWLAQVLFASLYGLGGWHLTRAVHHVALVGSLLVAAATCRRDATSPFSVAMAMTIGFVVMLSNADLRPQSFGLLGFAALLALAHGRLPFGVKLIVAAALLVTWQNMHPSVVLGMVAMGGLAAADLLDRKRVRGSPWELVALSLLAMVSQFATPVGAGILEVARVNLRISRDILRVGEWLPPWDPAVLGAVVIYWVVLLGSVIAMFRLRERLSVRDRTMFIVMTILTLSAARFIVFWAVALVPLWAEMVEQLVPSGMFVWARRQGNVPVRAVRSMIGLTAGAAIVLGLHPAQFGPVLPPGIPLAGVRGLRVLLPGPARIYNARVWAGPLLLDGAQEWHLAVDGRLYFFHDPREWQAIEDASAGRISLDELERRHQPDAFFLYPAGDRRLIESLSLCARWRACHSGPTCVAFVRAR